MVAYAGTRCRFNKVKGSFWLIRLACCIILVAAGADSIAAPVPGDQIKPFTMVSSGGKPVQWKPGRVTVISCMAFWCDTWKTQAPRLDLARKASGVLPVDFVQVIIDGRYSKYLASTPFEYWLDRDGSWSKVQKIDRVPYTFVLDAAGRIRWASYGIVRSEVLSAEIRKALRPSNDGGLLYLTFDDFPGKGANELLDTLRAKDVKATFFCIGTNAESQKDAVRRAANEGHSVQMHSWSHDAKAPELDKLTKLLIGLGAKPTLYRPPGSESILRGDTKLNLRVVDPYDFANPKPEELERRIMHRVSNGSVIQLHSGAAVTQKMLGAIIDALKARGFRFGLINKPLPKRFEQG